MLSRVTWPVFSTQKVIASIGSAAEQGSVQRICIQAINHPAVFSDLVRLATDVKAQVKVPVSVSCQPLNKEQMKRLAEAGVDRVSIALDAATPELFEKVKGATVQSPYTWERQRQTLRDAVQVFGKNSVSTHLIVGLGENEQQITETLQWCVDNGVCPSLFAFTPILGTALGKLPQPLIITYRRLQLARYFIFHGKARFKNMKFNDKGCIVDWGVSEQLMKETLDNGAPFQTSGCPSCNRPYYNEKPGGPLYNYPRPLTPQEIEEIKKQLERETP